MRTSHLRAAATGLSCLAGVALLAPAGSAAAAGHQPAVTRHPARAAAHHPHGLYVVDHRSRSGKVASFRTPSAMVRDNAGGEHIVTTRPLGSDPREGRIVYFTRSSDSSPWRSHAVPGAHPLGAGIQVEIHLSDNGRRVYAVFYQCDGIYITDTSIKAVRLPVPSKLDSADGDCAAPPASGDNPPVARAESVSGRTVGVLVSDQQLGDTVWAIDSGVPGGQFTMGTALPSAAAFSPVQVAGDPVYGRTVVVGTGYDGAHEGIYVTYQDRFADSWSAPVRVATLDSATTDYKIDSVQTFRRHVYIGLEKPAGGTTSAHRLYLVKGQPSGQWLGAVPLPHSNGHDRGLRLVVNTQTDNLHAVWTRIVGSAANKKSGLMHESQSDVHWNKPYYLTHWGHDVATQITLTDHYKPVVAYNQ